MIQFSWWAKSASPKVLRNVWKCMVWPWLYHAALAVNSGMSSHILHLHRALYTNIKCARWWIYVISNITKRELSSPFPRTYVYTTPDSCIIITSHFLVIGVPGLRVLSPALPLKSCLPPPHLDKSWSILMMRSSTTLKWHLPIEIILTSYPLYLHSQYQSKPHNVWSSCILWSILFL